MPVYSAEIWIFEISQDRWSGADEHVRAAFVDAYPHLRDVQITNIVRLLRPEVEVPLGNRKVFRVTFSTPRLLDPEDQANMAIREVE